MERAEGDCDLEPLAKQAGLSPSHFHRIFKRLTGVTPKAYATEQRNQRLRDDLSRSKTVTSAIYSSGFNSSSRFYATSAKVLGMGPAQYRDGGPGAQIRFASGACSLGCVMVAASIKGVCAILLGSDPHALAGDLRARFPKAKFKAGDVDFGKIVAKVVAFVDTPGRRLDFPLDIQGTAFQHRVWAALCEIPLGSTASYTEIAGKIGQPNSARAVAKACGANPLAVAVPCHRVVRGDGALSGYRWGIERKRALLEREARQRAKKRVVAPKT
jgi:AraC family transcriptional regulator, regulatory protein of adaptative response / methylated-DNA-[protein]-cysteine methyltransferase